MSGSPHSTIRMRRSSETGSAGDTRLARGSLLIQCVQLLSNALHDLSAPELRRERELAARVGERLCAEEEAPDLLGGRDILQGAGDAFRVQRIDGGIGEEADVVGCVQALGARPG